VDKHHHHDYYYYYYYYYNNYNYCRYCYYYYNNYSYCYYHHHQVCIKKSLSPTSAKIAASGFVSIHYMYFGLILVTVTTIVGVVVSHMTPPPLPSQLDNTTYWGVKERTRSKKKEEKELPPLRGGRGEEEKYPDKPPFDYHG